MTTGAAYVTGGVQFGATLSDFGGGAGGVVGITNATTVPSTNPSNGAVVYAEGGVVKVRQLDGSIVPLEINPNPGPSANALIGWAYDVSAATSNVALATGVVHMSKVWVSKPTTITNVLMRTVSTAGVGLTNCYMGLYDLAGNRLGVTADLSTSWMGSTGNRVHALTAGVPVTPGWYFVAFLMGAATTAPGISRSAVSDIHNINLTAAAYRCGTIGTSLTALPATLTLSGMASSSNFFWAGVS